MFDILSHSYFLEQNPVGKHFSISKFKEVVGGVPFIKICKCTDSFHDQDLWLSNGTAWIKLSINHVTLHSKSITMRLCLGSDSKDYFCYSKGFWQIRHCKAVWLPLTADMFCHWQFSIQLIYSTMVHLQWIG